MCPYGLDIGKVIESLNSTIPAIAAHFDSSAGHGCVVPLMLVDIDCTRLQQLSHPSALGEILSEDH